MAIAPLQTSAAADIRPLLRRVVIACPSPTLGTPTGIFPGTPIGIFQFPPVPPPVSTPTLGTPTCIFPGTPTGIFPFPPVLPPVFTPSLSHPTGIFPFPPVPPPVSKPSSSHPRERGLFAPRRLRGGCLLGLTRDTHTRSLQLAREGRSAT